MEKKEKKCLGFSPMQKDYAYLSSGCVGTCFADDPLVGLSKKKPRRGRKTKQELSTDG